MESLLALGEQLGVEVRAEPMGGKGGGLCRLKGKTILFLDTSADLATRYDRTVAAMATIDGIDEHYLIPEVRRDLERAQMERRRE
jgi:hypothetical protein